MQPADWIHSSRQGHQVGCLWVGVTPVTVICVFLMNQT